MNIIEKLIDLLDPLGGLAKACGIVGLTLGIFYLILKSIIKKTVFSTLNEKNSFKIIRLLIFIVFALSVLGFIYGILLSAKPISKDTSKIDTLNYEPLRLKSKGVKIVDSVGKKR